MTRKKLLQLSSAVFVLCVSVSVSTAGTFYVDNSGSTACSNSSTSGSAASPWCTINYGIGRIASGDTLNIKAGTYNEDVFINRPAGTAATPTVIQAFPGHIVTIRGSGIDSGRVKIENTSYITFDGFLITNFNQGLHVNGSDHIIVQNTTVHHVGQEGIHVQFNSSFVTVQNNTIHDTRQWQFNGEGIYVGSGSTSAPDNSHHVTVRGNTVYNVNDEAIEIKPGTHDCIVEGNDVSAALLDPAYSGAGAGTIEINESINGNQVWNSNPNHIVRNNIVHNTKMGIRAGTGVTVYNNVVYNINASFPGIYANNLNGDSYTRRIYHNTVDLPSSRAIVLAGGATDVKNNIGPTTANNVGTSDSYFVNKAGANYRLASGAAPIDGGLDLTAIVATDLQGTSRLTSLPPDLGAYEFAAVVSRPSFPTGLTLQ